MSFIRPALTVVRSRTVRFASTATPAYVRKPLSTARKAASPSSSSTTSRAALSSSKPAPAAAPMYDDAPPLPSFDDIDPPSRAASSSAAPRSSGSGYRDAPTPPAPMNTFPDENYTSLPDASGTPNTGGGWDTSFSGLSFQPFDKEVADILLKEVTPAEIEVKPDGILYMPEIRYRRRLNQAFGPGGWGLAPRGGSLITDRQVSREWGLVCLGRLVAVARGESEFFDATGINNAHEGAKSNALMRCCKDLGIAGELWDPTFIRKFKADHVLEVWTTHITRGNKKKLFRKKTDPKFTTPFKE